ncbi:hypothetical protein KGA66_27760 [Actinocrinis puniceicyclus]|uniref:Uncharacterized protein n=1 Tax=Actinocrinis puniceicyclus TaxID=977794 RepID=A0A8J8BG78_9ACTN|nr:hypothetical protein [Actinocrinis puniceicyclus]MBS2966861.1 hypothetical protein [Actinocrinis puniceicyclus]
MRRTSFVGALIVIAVGGVLGFAFQSSPKWLDLHATGLIIMLAGIADLVIRFALGISPLLSPETADVAALVEPEGEPVLDVFGNPIVTAPPPTMLQAPPLAVPVPYSPAGEGDPRFGDGTGTSVPPSTVSAHQASDETRDIPIVESGYGEAGWPADPMQRYATRDRAVHDQVVRQVGDYEAPEALAPVSALTGRPVRGAWRRRRR